jgi:hypothetical protein
VQYALRLPYIATVGKSRTAALRSSLAETSIDDDKLQD